MKTFLSIIIAFFTANCLLAQKSWIRINQLGYTPNSIKVAVLISKEKIELNSFTVYDISNNKVLVSKNIKPFGTYTSFASTFRLNFSDLTTEGKFYIAAGNVKSPVFTISKDIYNGTADFLLKYMRQQQCGYNPFLKDSCHTHDGFIIYHPTLDSTFINVVGGWHDASDYLKYVTTSANATFQMLFAYQQNPNAFDDKYDANGDSGSNGIPDILDEAKWGLDWLDKMNPDSAFMFNQVADDRDHIGFKLPTLDSAYYGKDRERPVYFCTGKPQGVFKYKNRTTGIASTAGKYASAFALGSLLLEKYYPEFSKKIRKKAFDAYDFGKANPGVCQTAPCTSPYFYEEDNWVDDMELAAVQLYLLSKNEKYLKDAVEFGKQEEVTPWMGRDTARHYQWYPFVNLGHYFLASGNYSNSPLFVKYLKKGIQAVYQRGKNNPFLFGVPFIWCSNNLVVAILTQCHLYENLTGDKTFAEMEASLRDWLFGCNPWGTSMIVGLPKNGDYPSDPHSAFSHNHNYPIDGGLVDGPVYGTIFKGLRGVTIYNGDEYAEFQSDYVVYHDDYGDYSTNEPTMDGTASLTYYLSALQEKSNKPTKQKFFKYKYGGIIRGDSTKKQITLVFTAHEFAEGLQKVRNVLKAHNIKGAFFFTGDFYRNPKFASIIRQLQNDGNYLGAHSDKHILYASWEKRDSTLISKKEFLEDLKKNFDEMAKFGITYEQAPYFLPPYEWYNADISHWCSELGLTLINFTPGTLSNQDWTYPELGSKYITSQQIFNNIINYEKSSPSGLNGFILLIHPGTDPRRKDKFYDMLNNLISELKMKGYKFVSLVEMLAEKNK
ncbi:glycoside hydrolase family 9 protein [Melioribacteraceae bacterium 4301-Me]|uniref:glycoside hydrolase family 9 protein n=1 Tax=Pyranulibacter aquaticus TaxID=3163344 RepID=UPI003598A1D6